MNNIYRGLLLGIGLALLPCGTLAWAAPEAAAPVAEIHTGQKTGQIVIPLDQSRLLHVDQPFRELSVGNKDIADVQPLSHDLIYVLGKKLGTTNLTIRDGNVLAVVDVIVTYDIDGLQRRLHDLAPNEDVKIAPAGDAISLSGTISSAAEMRQILDIAEQFAPGKVVNLLSIGASQQVLLELKFAEVGRNALMNLGVNTGLKYVAGGSSLTAATGSAAASTTFGTFSGALNFGNYSLMASLNALQTDGLVRTLAEPNLVALSGDTASFLAGGEIPIPVAQSTTGTTPLVTVQYKDFGVGLSYTPTIIGSDLVNLVVKSEVSSIDPTLSVQLNGFNIPGLQVRRATTTIEMRDGQSFAIAGLLQDDFSNGTSKLPGLGNIPILGALFRSVNYQHQQTDLVVIMTVHIVQPTVAKNLSTPLDTLVVPAPLDHLGTGDVEKDNGTSVPDSDKKGYVLP